MLSSPPEVFKSLLGQGKCLRGGCCRLRPHPSWKGSGFNPPYVPKTGLQQHHWCKWNKAATRYPLLLRSVCFCPFTGGEFHILRDIKWEVKYVHGVNRQYVFLKLLICTVIFLSEGLLQGHCSHITTMMIMWFPHKGWCHQLNIRLRAWEIRCLAEGHRRPLEWT